MLVSRLQPQRREVPLEPGQWIEFKLLSWKDFQEAEDLKTKKTMSNVSGISPEALAALASNQADNDEDEKKLGDPYDVMTLVEKSVVAWSYEDEVTVENIRLLDYKTVDWAFPEIIDMNFRSELEGEGFGAGSETTTSGTVPTQES